MKNFFAIICSLLLFSLNTFAQAYSESFDGVSASVTSGLFGSGTGRPTLNSKFAFDDFTINGSVVAVPATHLNFDGVNDAVSATNANLPLGNTAKTIEAWVKTTQNNIGEPILTYGNLSTNNRFSLYQAGGKLAFVAEFNDYNTNVAINDGIWHHVAATHDGTTLKIYLDGVQVGTSQAQTFNTIGTQISIGHKGNALEYFNGNIDEIRVWNTALSADDILRRKNCELQGTETGLVAYYKFNQGLDGGSNTAITTLTDATAGGNNGTLTNFALSGATSNWVAGSPVTTPISTTPSVSSPIFYVQGTTATALTATGTSLKWYTAATGGTSSTTAPTPSTATAGTTSYWVSQTSGSSCESERARIDVSIVANEFAQRVCIGTATGTESRLGGAEVADFDGDGFKDIIAQDDIGIYRLYKNTGTGNFNAGITIPPVGGAIAIGDIDGDNDLDIANSNGKVYLNNGSGVFTQLGTGIFHSVNASIENVKIADFNKDGKKDLLWLNTSSTANDNEIWFNTGTTGNANFALTQTIQGIGSSAGSVVGDIDNDGDIDIITCGNGGWNAKVYKNNGIGTFTTSQTLTTYTGTGFLADWDNDGDIDFLAFDYYNNWGLRFWKNDGTGTFSAPSSNLLTNSSIVSSVSSLVDLNNDGYLDVVLTQLSLGRFLLNNGCTLTLNNQVLSSSYYGVKVADFNDDGKMDFFCGGRDVVSCIYLNYLKNEVNVPLPTVPSVSASVTYCQTATASPLTATGANLKWYTAATGGTSIAAAPTPSTTTAGTTSYWVTSLNTNGCESDRIKTDVNINAAPTAPTATAQSFCASATVASLVATGTTIKWYAASTGGTALVSTTALTTGATYYASQTNANGCESVRTGVVVTLNSILSAPTVTPSVFYCQNAITSPLTAAGSNLKWFTTATGGTGISTAPTPSTATVNTSSFWVSQTVNGCESARAKMDVTINPLATAPTAANQSFCGSATVTNLVALGLNIQWYAASTGGSALVSTTNLTTGATYFVSQTNANGCESARTGVVVTINTVPSAPTATAQSFCGSATVANLIATGATLNWYSASTGGTALVSTTVLTTGTTYFVSQTNANGCESARTSVVVTINSIPNAPTVTPSVFYCQNAISSPLTAAGSNLKWYTTAAGGTGIATAPTPSTATVKISSFWVSQTTNGCESDRAKMDVVINSLPAAPTATPSVFYCQNATASPLTATGTNLAWFTTATAGTGIATAPTPSTTTVGTTSYWVMSIDTNGCLSERTKIDIEVGVFKNGLPKLITLCKDQYFTFNLKNDKYPNLTHSWTSSNGYNSKKETDTLKISGTYYVETTTALGCRSKDTVALTINNTDIESNFAVATELITIDVIKIVNISKTNNDSSRWIIPNGLKVNSNTPTLLELIASDTGSYKLGLITYKGGCNAVSYQDVKIYPKTFDQKANDSLYFVKKFTAYPNPNRGENLNVLIELSKESSVRLRLIDISTNFIISDKTLSNSSSYNVDYGGGFKKGSYVLFLESPYGRNVIKIIVL